METKLKVKLEDIVLLGESITKLAPEVYGLHRKIVDVQEPKTPTQEQIEEILSVVPVEDGKYVIPQIITEWEKIRNQQ